MLHVFSLQQQRAFLSFPGSSHPAPSDRCFLCKMVVAYLEGVLSCSYLRQVQDQRFQLYSGWVQWKWLLDHPDEKSVCFKSDLISRLTKPRYHTCQIGSFTDPTSLFSTARFMSSSDDTILMLALLLSFPILSSYISFKAEALFCTPSCTSTLLACQVLGRLLRKLMGSTRLSNFNGQRSPRLSDKLVESIIEGKLQKTLPCCRLGRSLNIFAAPWWIALHVLTS